jgi:hypothetical protein
LVECLYKKHCGRSEKNTIATLGLFARHEKSLDSRIAKICRHYESNQQYNASTGDQSTKYRKFLSSLDKKSRPLVLVIRYR